MTIEDIEPAWRYANYWSSRIYSRHFATIRLMKYLHNKNNRKEAARADDKRTDDAMEDEKTEITIMEKWYRLLRLTAGGVDDGKSTLVGRLFMIANIFSRPIGHFVEESSKNKGFDYVDLYTYRRRNQKRQVLLLT